jgi:hypothetical protein
MKTLKYGFQFAAAIIFLFNAQCSREQQKTAKSEAALLSEAEKIEQAMDSAWQVMIASDDNKLNNILLLADRISYLKNYHDTEITNLKQRVEALRKQRYSRSDIEVSERIDAYDDSTNLLLTYMRNTLSQHPDANNFQIILQLQEEIAAADDSMILYRKGYDAQVDRWNTLVSKKADALQKAGKQNTKPLPLFRLIP